MRYRYIPTMSYLVTNFYKFTPLEPSNLEELKGILKNLAKLHKIKGLFLIGPEGVNATLAGTPENVRIFKTWLEGKFGSLDYKDNGCAYVPFKNFQVKIRPEIVSLGRTDIVPDHTNSHLTPEEWNKALQEKDVVVIDTRNWYEVEIGKFKNAVSFGLNEFQEFPEKIKSSNIPKDKKVLIYCTGGIRCEKAIYEMQNQGFKNVHQLQGGIIKYLEKYPHQEYEGDCFVFDRRCAVDQNLQPTTTHTFCPHCGQPAKDEIQCRRCSNKSKVCQMCLDKHQRYHTCSKNCAHHIEKGSGLNKKNQGITRQQLHEMMTDGGYNN